MLLALLGAYAAVGILFAVPFLARGAGHVDPAAAGTSWGFKLLVLPGVAAFWPYLALRWALHLAPPEERSPHRLRARSAGDDPPGSS